MKRASYQVFRINSPYGIIIRLSDLRYSWFNRNYKELYDETQEYLPWEKLYKFDGKLKDVSVIEKIKDFAEANKEYGMSYSEETVKGFSYLSVWLYNDSNFPYTLNKEVKRKMDKYNKVLLDLEQII